MLSCSEKSWKDLNGTETERDERTREFKRDRKEKKWITTGEPKQCVCVCRLMFERVLHLHHFQIEDRFNYLQKPHGNHSALFQLEHQIWQQSHWRHWKGHLSWEGNKRLRPCMCICMWWWWWGQAHLFCWGMSGGTRTPREATRSLPIWDQRQIEISLTLHAHTHTQAQVQCINVTKWDKSHFHLRTEGHRSSTNTCIYSKRGVRRGIVPARQLTACCKEIIHNLVGYF